MCTLTSQRGTSSLLLSHSWLASNPALSTWFVMLGPGLYKSQVCSAKKVLLGSAHRGCRINQSRAGRGGSVPKRTVAPYLLSFCECHPGLTSPRRKQQPLLPQLQTHLLRLRLRATSTRCPLPCLHGVLGSLSSSGQHL